MAKLQNVRLANNICGVQILHGCLPHSFPMNEGGHRSSNIKRNNMASYSWDLVVEATHSRMIIRSWRPPTYSLVLQRIYSQHLWPLQFINPSQIHNFPSFLCHIGATWTSRRLLLLDPAGSHCVSAGISFHQSLFLRHCVVSQVFSQLNFRRFSRGDTLSPCNSNFARAWML